MSDTTATPSVHVPDVLETLAQLPNDDVYTPPKVVAAMLDILPEHVWSEPDYRWLDPATKSGIYLREVFKRLMVGLAEWQPDGLKRREHILKSMIFGAATTQLNGEIARRTLYQTRDATGVEVKDPSLEDLVVHFDYPEGNVPYVETEHVLDKKQQFCTVCRAPAKLIRERRESFAYSFIHGTYPTKELAAMKFDVIVGNPPYQIGMDDGKGNRTANITPLYNLFVEKAIAMNPRYLVMITPSRWFAGGKGLNEFRDRMIADRRLRVLVDNPKQYDVFPQAEIQGGVSYFLWDRDHDGDCEFATRLGGVTRDVATRDLRDGEGVVLRDNYAAAIVGKVTKHPSADGFLGEIVSPMDPFGQGLKTNYGGKPGLPLSVEPQPGMIPLIFATKVAYTSPAALERRHEWLERWKVLLPMAYNGGRQFGPNGEVVETVIGEPIALAPGSACTQSYLVAGHFGDPEQAENYAHYLSTKFVRFLVLQRKISQHVTPDRFAFVPIVDFSQRWTDLDLYSRFELAPEEIAYIEASIKPRSLILSLDSPVPATHLPGGRKFRAGDALDEPEVERDVDE